MCLIWGLGGNPHCLGISLGPIFAASTFPQAPHLTLHPPSLPHWAVNIHPAQINQALHLKIFLISLFLQSPFFYVRSPICGFWRFRCSHIWGVLFSLPHCVVANVLFQLSENIGTQRAEKVFSFLSFQFLEVTYKKRIVSLDSDTAHQLSQIARP